jgi:hypothetical protein
MDYKLVTGSAAISSARLFFRTRNGVSTESPVSNSFWSSRGRIVMIRSLSLPSSNVSSFNSSSFSRSSTKSKNFLFPMMSTRSVYPLGSLRNTTSRNRSYFCRSKPMTQLTDDNILGFSKWLFLNQFFRDGVNIEFKQLSVCFNHSLSKSDR